MRSYTVIRVRADGVVSTQSFVAVSQEHAIRLCAMNDYCPLGVAGSELCYKDTEERGTEVGLQYPGTPIIWTANYYCIT